MKIYYGLIHTLFVLLLPTAALLGQIQFKHINLISINTIDYVGPFDDTTNIGDTLILNDKVKVTLNFIADNDDAFVKIYIDANGDGEFDLTEERIDNFTSPITSMDSVNFTLPQIFSDISKFKITLSETDDSLDLHEVLVQAQNNCPPIIVDVVEDHGARRSINCLPLGRFQKIRYKNTDTIAYDLMELKINDTIIPANSPSSTLMPNDSIDIIFDLKDFSLYECFTRNLKQTFVNSGMTNIRTIPFKIACCPTIESTDVTFDVGDQFSYATKTTEKIILNGNTNTSSSSIDLQGNSFVYLQAEKAIEWNPGVEITATDSSFLKAYIASCPGVPLLKNGFVKVNTLEIESENRVGEEEEPLERRPFKIYPNPFNDQLKIDFDSPEDSFVSLRIFDLAGAQISQFEEPEFKEQNSLVFNVEYLPKGTYFVGIQTKNRLYIEKMIKL